MNKLREFRAKSPQLGGNFLNSISRSCSNVSHKFLRRSPGRRANHHRAISSGSYDLTGATEHRLEIGHPILINKTAIDVDSIDLRSKPTEADSMILEADSIAESEESELSCAPHLQEISFSFLPEEEANTAEYEIPPNPKRVSPQETPPKTFSMNKSKSSTNLHKSELTVYLRRCSSVRLIKHQVSTIEIPREDLRTHVPGRKSLPPEFPPPPPPPIISENQYETAGSHLRRASYSKAVKDSDSGEEIPKEPSLEDLQDILESMKKETEQNPGKSLTHILSESRINLLKGRNLKMPHFNASKAKNAWSGFRHWVEEEVAKVRPHAEEEPEKDDPAISSHQHEEENSPQDEVTLSPSSVLSSSLILCL